MAAQDANKIAAGAAVTLFGADETLMERLGDVRSGDDNDGVWAKYVGGKIKVDGLKGDNDFKYNGFAAEAPEQVRTKMQAFLPTINNNVKKVNEEITKQIKSLGLK